MYGLGLDVGTTFTAAAVGRQGRVDICSLGTHGAVIPSVVLLREDGSQLFGESAERRAVTESTRLAREFKRRFGDSTPLLLGGTPCSPEVLTAWLLAHVIAEVTTRQGETPAALCITYPANWGSFKTDLLRHAIRLAGVTCPVTYATEPVAAAVYFGHGQRVAPGKRVAVYDLGGGTFDAAVLECTPTGFEILGHPEGIERLGGVDIDAAVFHHVVEVLGKPVMDLDENDPRSVAAMSRLRQECTAAKEGLSSDTDVIIPVLLPGVNTEVRLTRAELETKMRPALHGSVEALRRALASASVEPADLEAILLVGGSSRMPLVAELVTAEFGRPVMVDDHPKHGVALGAAWLASAALDAASSCLQGLAGADSVGSGAARASAVEPRTAERTTQEGEGGDVPTSAPVSSATASKGTSAQATAVPRPPAAPAPDTATPGSGIAVVPAARPAARLEMPPDAAPVDGRRRMIVLIGSAVAVVLLFTVIGLVIAIGRRGSSDVAITQRTPDTASGIPATAGGPAADKTSAASAGSTSLGEPGGTGVNGIGGRNAGAPTAGQSGPSAARATAKVAAADTGTIGVVPDPAAGTTGGQPNQSTVQGVSAAVATPPTIPAQTLPDATVGKAYSASLRANDGQPPYTWTLLSGRLPTGLTLTSGGTITGTATAKYSGTITVRVRDANQLTDTAAVSITSVQRTGDVNGDGNVNCADIDQIKTDFNTTNPRSDLNADGKVDVFDLSIALSNVDPGVTCPSS